MASLCKEKDLLLLELAYKLKKLLPLSSKAEKNLKNPKKPTFCRVFLGGFFWAFLGGFFWVGFFYPNPAKGENGNF